jgi:5-methylcytosine-specific restriction endonuclease McrA
MPIAPSRAARSRAPIPYEVQVEVFFRDRWLCSHCRRPTIFGLSLKLLSEFVAANIPGRALAYWDPQWRRDKAPLLDELAASVDHVHAYAKGGPHDITNFATICARCNARKGTRSREEHLKADPSWKVKAKYGEPAAWDGLSSVFMLLARRATRKLTPTERAWLAALESHWAQSI